MKDNKLGDENDEKSSRRTINHFFELNKYDSFCWGNEGTDYFGSDDDYLSTEDTCNGWSHDPRAGVVYAQQFGEHKYVLNKYLKQFERFRNQEIRCVSFSMPDILLRCAYIVAEEGGLIQVMRRKCKEIGLEVSEKFQCLSNLGVKKVKRELNEVPVEGMGKRTWERGYLPRWVVMNFSKMKKSVKKRLK